MPTTSYKLSACRRGRRVSSSKGFTLIEVVVAVFIFSIIMLAVSQTFIAAFQGYNNTKTVQRDLEAAQFALNLLAKELRTSSVVSVSGSQTFVKFYDYSQKICFQYRISGAALQAAKESAADLSSCQASSFGSGSFTTISSGTVTGAFFVTPSTQSPKAVGKAALSLVISEGAYTANIQTSVSLRDFGYVGL